jgi:outer membrane protein assembly factor BamB
MSRYIFLLLFVLFLPNTTLLADNWPQFRGANFNNLPNEKSLPTEWDETKNILWKIELPGLGWSSPIIWDNKVFVSTAVLDKSSVPAKSETETSSTNNRRNRRNPNPPDGTYALELHCLDLNTGKTIWKKVAYKGKPSYATHRDNTYASETPVTDGEHIYVYYGNMGLHCFDMSGNLKWKKDLGVYKMQSRWGTASSPLLYGDTILMQMDNEDDSFLAALDKKSGEEKWRIQRDEKSNWGTPIIWKNKARTELVTPGKVVRSYDLETKKVLWELAVGGGRNICSPTGDNDYLVIGNEERRSGGGFLFAVKAGASGNITPMEGQTTSSGVAWSHEDTGISMSSPLIYKDYVYIVERRRGAITCFETQSGKIMYQREELAEAKSFWSSPWAHENKIYCLDDTGTTHIVQAGPQFKLLQQNKIDDKFWPSPAISNGKLVLRGLNTIYCVQ